MKLLNDVILLRNFMIIKEKWLGVHDIYQYNQNTWSAVLQ